MHKHDDKKHSSDDTMDQMFFDEEIAYTCEILTKGIKCPYNRDQTHHRAKSGHILCKLIRLAEKIRQNSPQTKQQENEANTRKHAVLRAMKQTHSSVHRRILVVDDDQKIVELVRLYLERARYQVLSAYDGVSALVIARQESPA